MKLATILFVVALAFACFAQAQCQESAADSDGAIAIASSGSQVERATLLSAFNDLLQNILCGVTGGCYKPGYNADNGRLATGELASKVVGDLCRIGSCSTSVANELEASFAGFFLDIASSVPETVSNPDNVRAILPQVVAIVIDFLCRIGGGCQTPVVDELKASLSHFALENSSGKNN